MEVTWVIVALTPSYTVSLTTHLLARSWMMKELRRIWFKIKCVSYSWRDLRGLLTKKLVNRPTISTFDLDSIILVVTACEGVSRCQDSYTRTPSNSDTPKRTLNLPRQSESALIAPRIAPLTRSDLIGFEDSIAAAVVVKDFRKNSDAAAKSGTVWER